MVKGLVGTMLKVGTGKTSLLEFCAIVEGMDCSKADFSVPAHGLSLVSVTY
jgi:tRNA pseudouridine38-40 synthase